MKKVTLNKNSWHFWIYSKVVGDTPPSSLCPYFWQMVIIILTLPIIIAFYLWFKLCNGIVFLFTKVLSRKKKTAEQKLLEYRKKEVREAKRKAFWNKAGDVMLWVCKWIILPICGLITGWVLYEVTNKDGFLPLLVAIGVFAVLSGLIISFIHLCAYIDKKWGKQIGKGTRAFLRFLNPLNWKLVKLLGIMIVATYKKMCPMVDWKE